MGDGGIALIFKDILEEVRTLRAEVAELRQEQKAGLEALSDIVADGGGRYQLDDAKLQEGISNLLAYDGRPRKGDG